MYVTSYIDWITNYDLFFIYINARTETDLFKNI